MKLEKKEKRGKGDYRIEKKATKYFGIHCRLGCILVGRGPKVLRRLLRGDRRVLGSRLGGGVLDG